MGKIKRSVFKNWDELKRNLPSNLDESAKEYGALKRQRKIKSGEMLLRLILIYAVVSSLRNTALWMLGLGLCDISRQAIEKRILQSEEWLSYLLGELLKQKIEITKPVLGTIKRIIIRDASVISRAGSTGTEWKVHLGWSPFDQGPTQITLTDHKGGEGLIGATVEEGDLFLGDRAYGIWATIQGVLDGLAFFIFRITHTNFPLVRSDGTKFDILAWLKNIDDDITQTEITVYAKDDDENRPLRLIAGRLPKEKVKEAQERVRQVAKKKKKEPNSDTLFVAGFCLLATNLPTDSWSTNYILSLYRVRWQIEWTFRRWKSLCGLDDLPSYPAPIAKPVLLAKLILLLLMQRNLSTMPWAQWWTEQDEAPIISSLIQSSAWHLHEIIRPAWVAVLFYEQPERFRRHLFSSRRQKRRWQLTHAAQQFQDLLPIS